MIRSMTGFARREQAAEFGSLAWELRTVNHRYLEVSLRLPEDFRAAEGEYRQTIAGVVRRGKVDAALYYRPAAAGARELDLDDALVSKLVERVTEIERRFGGIATINTMDLLRWPGVVREGERDNVAQLAASHGLLKSALDSLTGSRESEGGRTAEALLSRAAALEQAVGGVQARLPAVRARLRTRLVERLRQVSIEPNADRLEQELVLALQRMDVDEEIDRLMSHVVELRKVIAGEEPAGRRLDFLMQEFNREANTLSSKSQDVETTRAAVDMKVLIEQMREQVQNVE